MILTYLMLIAIVIIVVVAINSSTDSKESFTRDDTEMWVEKELMRKLTRKGYVVFGDLIIPSVSKKISSTQIDHVIISPFGIFCLETKSHQGNIYGNEHSAYWKQYLGNGKYDLYNPIKQNGHHVRSLEYLLRSRLKSPIHSYVVFPSANRIKINGEEIDLTLRHTVDRILRHTRQIYSSEDVEAMAKGLALVSSKSIDFRENHINSVREFVGSHKRHSW